jgi:ribonuclease P protein component
MLPKKYRLAKEKDFQKVFRDRKSFAGQLLILRIRENEMDFSRFGFSVSLKISQKAVERNKTRRQAQEAVRINLGKIKPGFDVVLIAKPESLGKGYKKIEEDLLGALRKADLILD